jgi:hypothetical protein
VTVLICLAIIFCLVKASAQFYSETTTNYASISFQSYKYKIVNNIWGIANSYSGTMEKVWARQTSTDSYSWDVGMYANIYSDASKVIAFPNIFCGSRGGTSTSYSSLPTQISSARALSSDWNFSVDYGDATSTFNAAYDLWYFDNTTDGKSGRGVPKGELMVWIYKKNWNPTAGYRGNFTINGINFNYYSSWTGSPTSWRYYAFIATSNRTSVTGLNLKSFQDFVQGRKDLDSTTDLYSSWWLTSVETGNEIKKGTLGITHYWYAFNVN